MWALNVNVEARLNASKNGTASKEISWETLSQLRENATFPMGLRTASRFQGESIRLQYWKVN